MSIDALIAALVESSDSVQDLGVTIHPATIPSLPLSISIIPIIGMLTGVLVVCAVVAGIVALVKIRSSRRERLALAAIQAGQPELAQELVRNRGTFRWVVGGIVAIVLINVFPWYATLILLLGIGAYYYCQRTGQFVKSCRPSAAETQGEKPGAGPQA
jgi:hypothetical protein